MNSCLTLWIARPFHRTSPSVGAAKPHSMRNRLVLPAPLEPSTCNNWPGYRARFKFVNNTRSPRTHSSPTASSRVVDETAEACWAAGHKAIGISSGKFIVRSCVVYRVLERYPAGGPCQVLLTPQLPLRAKLIVKF